LTDRLELLASALATEIALRPWAAFVLSVLSTASRDDVMSPRDAEELISNALPVLGLFRDPLLFSHRNLERELNNNRHIAQLRDPSGRELEQEDWLRRIEQADFAVDHEERSDAPAERRATARSYILNRSQENRAAAPLYREWMRIFDAKSKRGLGEQIRAELDRIGGAPLERFDELSIDADLDDKDREAAQRLIEDDTDVGNGRSLFEVIPGVLRRRVERVATPGTVRVEEPLRGILQAVLSLAGEDGAELALHPLDPDPPAGTLHVFALLFGATLKKVAADSDGRLEIDSELTRMGGLPASPSNEDETPAVETEQDPWAELRLALTTRDGESGVNLAWNPRDIAGYVLFAQLIACAGRVSFPLAVDAFDVLLDDACELGGPPERTPMDGGVASRWIEKRSEFLGRFASDGLEAAPLTDYATAWTETAEVLVALVAQYPENRERWISEFLDVDLAQTADGREIWMLATHPLRLRWVARDLEELAKHLVAALKGNLNLNPENSTLFFSWLDRVSPHRQPPMLCSSERNYLPAQELTLHEQYVRTEVHRQSVGEQMDTKTAGEITGIIDSYLDSFPSKVDRFVLLILTRTGDVRLIEQVLRRTLIERKPIEGLQRLDLHLVAPVEHHRKLARAAAAIQVETSATDLLPRLRTVMHAWPEEQLPPLDDLDADVDIAIVPEVLGSSATLNDHTAERTDRPSSFDPWLDKPVHVPVESRHQTDVTIELLPSEPDTALEMWSTLNVRRRRTAVGSDPRDIDRVSLDVQVNRGLELFQRLHDVAQWVVTVDEFVGREQIDAIPDPPDVILVRSGRGKNELYTLVVSSRAGRRFVEAGLRRKLRSLDLGIEPGLMEHLASRLYDLARNTAPSVVLRAVGLGRTLEEILGLVTTRVLVEQALPSPRGDGADWWISLDDHTDWFGGASKSRADIARVCLRRTTSGTELWVDVIEAKFRKGDDSEQAARQVLRTLRIIEAGLDPTQQRADTRFWQEELARAIDGVSRRPVASTDLPGFVRAGHPSDEVLDELRAALRAGEYELTVRGVACAIAVTSQSEMRTSLESNVYVIHTPRSVAHAVLRTLADGADLPTYDVLRNMSASREPVSVERAIEAEATASAVEDEVEDDEAVTIDGPRPVLSAVPEQDLVVTTDVFEPSAAPSQRMSMETLRQRLQTVVDKLDELRVPVQVPDDEPFDEGPGFYLLRVEPGRGVRVQQIQQRTDDLRLALGLEMDQSLRTYQHRGAVVIEVPKNDSERYPVMASDLWSEVPVDSERLVIPVGEDIAGDPVTLDLSSPNSPHLLVAGMTGSGKSVALETLLRGACRYPPDRLQILAVDPKGTELRFLEALPHLRGRLGLTPDNASDLLEEASSEMERRYAVMSAAHVSSLEDYNRREGAALPWWIVVLDEYADLAIDSDDRKKIEPKMLKLAQKARAAGIHLIVATQRPSADILNTSVRANFPAQLALRVRSGTESLIILGESGAEALAGKGDALLRTSSGLTRVQCALTNA
jgi:hypothetical protein